MSSLPLPPIPLVPVILGQTASGKTEVSLSLARKLGRGQIVMADSMAVYRGMDIGTAKPSPAERAGVAHHCIDIVDADSGFSVADYVTLARAALESITAQGARPIIVCGTGLYLRALVEGLAELPGEDAALRKKLREEEDETPGSVYARLCALDPVSAGRIHPNNIKRLIRAVEVCVLAGRPFSSFMAEKEGAAELFPNVKFGLRRKKAELYARIGERVDRMFDEGLVDEVRRLLARFPGGLSVTARQAIGYKEVLDLLAGKYPVWTAREMVKSATRLYAKRQMTWFARLPDVEWIDLVPDSSPDKVADIILNRLESRAGRV